MFDPEHPFAQRVAQALNNTESRTQRSYRWLQRSYPNRIRNWMRSPLRSPSTVLGTGLRRILGAVTRWETIALPIVIVCAVIYAVHKYPSVKGNSSPSNSQRHVLLTTDSPSAAAPLVDPTSAPVKKSQGLHPPTGFPTTQAPGVPPAALLGKLQRAATTYYATQTKQDSPVGTKVWTVTDMAHAKSQPLTSDQLYVTMPVKVYVSKPHMVAQAYYQVTYSLWQSQSGDSWTMVSFKTDNTAHGG